MTRLAVATSRAGDTALGDTGDAVLPSADPFGDLQRCLDGAGPSRILQTVIGEVFAGRITVVSSFAADSAVLLHWWPKSTDRRRCCSSTQGDFPEAIEHRDRLVRHLGLRDFRSVRPSPEEASRLDAGLRRAALDSNGCCAFRKVAPLERALAGFAA
ncbi:phosphoadenosine phosphosulfate reductase family protein [Reyranella sp.]|uniref:phosphoadenosine phosphosulfate reductase domain-containing protein n=1 Tax=Reyranella sp. TaxID=1929291 RepID=UPI003C7A61A4